MFRLLFGLTFFSFFFLQQILDASTATTKTDLNSTTKTTSTNDINDKTIENISSESSKTNQDKIFKTSTTMPTTTKMYTSEDSSTTNPPTSLTPSIITPKPTTSITTPLALTTPNNTQYTKKLTTMKEVQKLISFKRDLTNNSVVKLDFETSALFNLSNFSINLSVNGAYYNKTELGKQQSSSTKKASILVFGLVPGAIHNISLSISKSTLNTIVITAPREACGIRRISESETTACFTWRQEGGFDAYEIHRKNQAVYKEFKYQQVDESEGFVDSDQKDNDGGKLDVDVDVDDLDEHKVTVRTNDDSNRINEEEKNENNGLNDNNDDVDTNTTFENFKTSEDAIIEGCLSDLTPGKTVEFEITTKFANLSSTPFLFMVSTKALKPEMIRLVNSTTNSICFNWLQGGAFESFNISNHENFQFNWSEIVEENNMESEEIIYEENVEIILNYPEKLMNRNHYNYYDDGINGHKIKETELQMSSNDSTREPVNNLERRSIEGCVAALTPGSIYKMSMYTTSEGKASDIESFSFSTNSSQPSEIQQINSTESCVCLAWKQAYNYDSFTCHVSFEMSEKSEILKRWRLVRNPKETKTLEKVKKYSEKSEHYGNQLEETCKDFTYQEIEDDSEENANEVQIEACVGGLEKTGAAFNISLASYVVQPRHGIYENSYSFPSCFVALTKPMKASQVEISTGSKQLGLIMSQPQKTSSISYKVTYSTNNEKQINQTCSEKCLLKDLNPDSKYNIQVYTVIEPVESSYCRFSEEASISIPFQWDGYTTPDKVLNANITIENNAVNLTWSSPSSHNNIISYSLLLSDSTNITLHCFRNDDVGYIRNYVQQVDNPRNCSLVMWYAFSDLINGKEYVVTIIPTNPGGSGEPSVLQFTFIPKIEAGFPVWAIIVLVFMLMFVLVGGMLAYFGRHNFAARCFPKYSTAGPPGVTITELEFQEPMPMKTCDFAEEVMLKHKDSDYIFSKEYEFLNERSSKCPARVALRPENKVKNRFIDILAYDHSRVKLSGGEMVDSGDVNDYINANFIPGCTSKREYIACQGPMKGTVDDFWRMVWDHKVTAIVMLTKLFEKGKEKCVKYWPDEQSQEFADVTVTMENLVSHDFYEEKTFTVAMGTEKRTLTHFWFLTWPDFGVPCKKQLLKFLKVVRSSIQPTHPTIIHCSAGVGRTGTFILLDRVLRSLEEDIYIDLFSVIVEMRQFRCRMVQTEAQYIFAHDCLLEELTSCPPSLCVEADYVNQSFISETYHINPSYRPFK